jgi:hypothetical protein
LQTLAWLVQVLQSGGAAPLAARPRDAAAAVAALAVLLALPRPAARTVAAQCIVAVAQAAGLSDGGLFSHRPEVTAGTREIVAAVCAGAFSGAHTLPGADLSGAVAALAVAGAPDSLTQAVSHAAAASGQVSAAAAAAAAAAGFVAHHGSGVVVPVATRPVVLGASAGRALGHMAQLCAGTAFAGVAVECLSRLALHTAQSEYGPCVLLRSLSPLLTMIFCARNSQAGIEAAAAAAEAACRLAAGACGGAGRQSSDAGDLVTAARALLSAAAACETASVVATRTA